MRRVFAPLPAIVLAACTSPAGDVPSAALDEAAPCREAVLDIHPVLREGLDAVVDTARAQGFDGQVAVIREGRVVYSRASGFADAGEALPLSRDTLFQISSTTKYVTAILVLQAAEQGRIDLDAPLDRWLPGTQIAARGTTVRDLLAHRSGLGASYVAEETDQAEAAVDAIDAVEFDESRIGSFRYSNDGYDLLGALLELAYDQPYERIAREQLFTPACIDAAFWGEMDVSDPQRVAQPAGGFPDSLIGRNYGMVSAAGLLMAAEDLARLQAQILDGSLLSDDVRNALLEPRGEMSLGEAAYGAFWLEGEGLGRVHSARGAMDWGDSTYLNTYAGCGLVLAITASSGQVEDGRYFRDVVAELAEPVLADFCALERP